MFPDDEERLRVWLTYLASTVMIGFIWKRWMEYQELRGIEQATMNREFWEQIGAEFGEFESQAE